MPVQLLYVQLTADKTNTAYLSCDVFAILRRKVQNSLPFYEFHQKLANNNVTKEVLKWYYLFIAADSVVDAVNFMRRIGL